MKNVIMGVVGSLVIIYTVAVTLGIYNMSTRKNELENCVSGVLERVMMDYSESYMLQPDFSPEEGEVTEIIKQNIAERVRNPEALEIDVLVCDMEKGIISVKVKENLVLPGGMEKEIFCRKTIIADREIGGD